MSTLLRSFLFFILVFSATCWASNPVVYFEPKSTKLTGVVTELVFPGPPNYESVKQGDKAEKGPYLVLSEPVDIAVENGAKNKGDETPAQNVQIIQLVVMNDKDWKDIKKGNKVEITGKLSSPITGHHHARALLDVDKVTVLSKGKISNHQLTVTKEDKDLLDKQSD